MNIKPLLLVFDNNNEGGNDKKATLDRYTFVLIDEKALSSKTVEYISTSKMGVAVYQHGDDLKMSDLRQFCEFSIVNNTVKCMWMFDVEYKTFLGQLRSFEKVDRVLIKKITDEFGNFNHKYPFVDFALPFQIAPQELTYHKYIETVLLKDFFSDCDVPSGFHTLVAWIKNDIQGMDKDNNEINDGTIATSYRHFIERSIENLDN